MKTERAIELARTAAALATLLGITPSAISQWGDDIPEHREWQLKVLKPDWFADETPVYAGPERRDVNRQPLAFPDLDRRGLKVGV